MPAPQTSQPSREPKASFAHINLMVDSFLANAEPDDLRAIIRTTLASLPPSTASTFTAAARTRLAASPLSPLPPLFSVSAQGLATPLPALDTALRRARALYGAGLGLSALQLLTGIVRATRGLRWTPDGVTALALAAADADVAQALQSAREEAGGGRADAARARETISALKDALEKSREEVEGWGGEFLFERAVVDVQCWKM